jgi:hypothetical protein
MARIENYKYTIEGAFDCWSTDTIVVRQELLITLSEDVWRIVPVEV